MPVEKSHNRGASRDHQLVGWMPLQPKAETTTSKSAKVRKRATRERGIAWVQGQTVELEYLICEITVDQKLSFEVNSHHVVPRGSLNEMLFLPELEEPEEENFMQGSERNLNT